MTVQLPPDGATAILPGVDWPAPEPDRPLAPVGCMHQRADQWGHCVECGTDVFDAREARATRKAGR